MKKFSRTTCVLAFIAVLTLSSACSKNDDAPDNMQGSKEMFASLNKMMEASRDVQLSSDPDNDFAILSAIQSATIIDLAKKEIQYGNNERMKNIARDLLESRNADLSLFGSIVNLHLPHVKMPEAGKQMILNFDQAEKNIHIVDATGDVNKDFATILIFLNQAAIGNAQLQLSKGDANLLKSVSGRIIEQQGQEVRYLQAWLIGNRNPD